MLTVRFEFEPGQVVVVNGLMRAAVRLCALDELKQRVYYVDRCERPQWVNEAELEVVHDDAA